MTTRRAARSNSPTSNEQSPAKFGNASPPSETARHASGHYGFNLPQIFGDAVRLGAVIHGSRHRRDARGIEVAQQALLASLNPRGAEFFRVHEWDVYTMISHEAGIRRNGGVVPRPGWLQELELVDAPMNPRQVGEALRTIGLGLADLRGDPQYHERGAGFLCTGTWYLWDVMGAGDQDAVRTLLRETSRIWGWPANPRRQPARFRGQPANLADVGALMSDWRTASCSDIDRMNELAGRFLQQGMRGAAAAFSQLPLRAPAKTPRLLRAAYEKVALALARASLLRVLVLPVIEDRGPVDWRARSDRTRTQLIEVPWGRMTVETAVTRCAEECREARAAFEKVEREILAAGDERIAFRDALAWLDRVLTVCDRALSGGRPWDQTAIALRRLPDPESDALIQGMRSETSKVRNVNPGDDPRRTGTDMEELAAWAGAELAGNLKRAIVELCDNGGRVPLATFTHLFRWQGLIDSSWSGLRRRMNEKLAPKHWLVRRKDNAAVLEPAPGTPRRAAKKTHLRRRGAAS